MWGRIGSTGFGRSVSPIDPPEERARFMLSFIGSWTSSIIGMGILSAAGGIMAAEEIWRGGYSAGALSTALMLVPPVIIGVTAGIFLGRWTTRRGLTRIKRNIAAGSTKPGGLTLPECLPWIWFLAGFAICFGSQIVVRGVLDLLPSAKTPALIRLTTGTAVVVHGLGHLLWWNAERRLEIVTLLYQALELERSRSM
jgi:hypothetical protein